MEQATRKKPEEVDWFNPDHGLDLDPMLQGHFSDCIARGDWFGAMWIVKKPQRVYALMMLWTYLTAQERYELAGEVWEDSENIYQYRWAWGSILVDGADGAESFMDDAEREIWRQLPDNIMIHRGFQAQRRTKWGLSWTLDYEAAQWFANRWNMLGKTPQVISADAKKSECFAYKNGRGEKEIILKPSALPAIRSRYHRQRRKAS